MPMPKRVLGKTGVSLPILGFGTAPAGKRLTQRQALLLYEAALNAGVAYFNTAPEFAGYGKAQEQLGYLVKARRRDMFLVTKCYDPTYEDALKWLSKVLNSFKQTMRIWFLFIVWEPTKWILL